MGVPWLRETALLDGDVSGGGASGGGGAPLDGDGADASAYDSESSSMIRLSNGMVLYLREVRHGRGIEGASPRNHSRVTAIDGGTVLLHLREVPRDVASH